MSTNYQAARVALGARLRELRTEAGFSGRALAERLGWPPSKISKLERGRQTPTAEDLSQWARSLHKPDVAVELTARLRALETHYASWRRQLSAGTRAKQDALSIDERQCLLFRNFEASCVPGLLQTPEYARHMLGMVTELHRTPADVEQGVNARMQRQQVLYEVGEKGRFRFLVWESALWTRVCPTPVLAGQLDRLAGAVGLSSVSLGVVPLTATVAVPPLHGFLIYDDSLVCVETIGAEVRVTDRAELANYREIWNRLHAAAVFGPQAHRLIGRARAALDSHEDVAAGPRDDRSDRADRCGSGVPTRGVPPDRAAGTPSL